MQLSDGEKLIIAMLADLLRAQKVKGEVDVDHVMSSIIGGHMWSVKQEMPGIFEAEEDNPADVRETANILDMWWFIELEFDKLNAADQARVIASNGGHKPVFGGFDANNDNHFGIASHWINDVGGFEHFKGRYLNSHSIASLTRYRRMYPKFEAIRPNLGARDLTADELIEILSA